MVYAEPYVYLRALGTFGSTSTAKLERWGVGLKFRNPGTAPSPAQLTAFAETAKAAFSTFHANTGVAAGTSCWLEEITAAYIGTDGKYVGGSGQQTTRSPLGTPISGTGSVGVPYTQALVYSLRTTITRGPGSNGRMYYPALGHSVVATTGLLASGPQGNAATAAGALFSNLNAGTGGLSVMSAVGTGIAAPVTSVRVGNKIDHQESRERSLVEAYTSAQVSTVAAFIGRDRSRPIGT